MGKTGNSTSKTATSAPSGRILLHLAPGLRQAIARDDIFCIEATGDGTRVRTRASRALRDVRSLGEIEPLLLRHGFLRTHGNYLVNAKRVRQVRRRPTGEDWELKLDPPTTDLPEAPGGTGSTPAASSAP